MTSLETPATPAKTAAEAPVAVPSVSRSRSQLAWRCALGVVPATIAWAFLAPHIGGFAVPLAVIVALAAAFGIAAGISAAWHAHAEQARTWSAAAGAVCVLALINPLVFAGIGTVITQRVGAITVSSEQGVVFWAKYPGVAGWDAPPHPPEGNAFAMGSMNDRALSALTSELSQQFGFHWSIGDRPSGLLTVPNGFGGASIFQVVNGADWTTSEFGGTPAERVALVAAAEATAETLGVGDPSASTGTWAEAGQPVASTGDIATGDGMRVWTGGAQTFVVTVTGQTVTLSYTAGPYARSNLYDGEYEKLFAGFPTTQPAPIAPITPGEGVGPADPASRLDP